MPLAAAVTSGLVLAMLLLAIAALALGPDGFLRIRFVLSRPAFETAATKMLGAKTIPTPTQLGAFRVLKIERVSGTVRFVLDDSPLNVGPPLGIVYTPSGSKPADGDSEVFYKDALWYRALAPRWWWWSE